MRLLHRFLLTLGLLCIVAAHPAVQTASQPAAATRAAFLDTIKRPKAPLDPSPAKVTTTEKGYRQELLSFASEPDERVPVLILKKDEGPQRRAVAIALHGTGGSKES